MYNIYIIGGINLIIKKKKKNILQKCKQLKIVQVFIVKKKYFLVIINMF